MVFWVLFDSCSGHYDAKNSYFCVFLMFFEDFARSQLLGSVNRRCTGAYESKKIKIAKNGPKHPQTIILCHIKGFRAHPAGLGHHTSQFIFPDFRGFWGVFEGNMAYMSTLQRLTSISKRVFLENFEGPRCDPPLKKKRREQFFFSP